MDTLAPLPRLSTKAEEDAALVQKAIGGSQKAYESLMARHRPSVQHLMLKMSNNRAEAADLTMEAFGKAFEKLPHYLPQYAFSTWLFRIAMNNCIDRARRRRLPVRHTGDAFADADAGFDLLKSLRAGASTPEDDLIREQRISMVRLLLDRLPERHRRILEMRFYEEMNYEEMAAALQVPLGTVKAQLFRAKEAFYQMLQSPYASAHLERTTRPPRVLIEA